MWKELIEFFTNSSDHKKLALKDKIWNIKMQKNETILYYLSIFTQVHDEFGGVGINVANDDLVSLSILGLTKSWHNYQD